MKAQLKIGEKYSAQLPKVGEMADSYTPSKFLAAVFD